MQSTPEAAIVGVQQVDMFPLRVLAPDKNKLYPNENIRTVCYIKNLPSRPNVERKNNCLSKAIF
ncbi:hypothetical protein GCM10010911_41500 [Paenibacillus nasutitermitis]|uniref:Uncharacterized protein n=1 Tax=Paenibacillus nasutitermitis TaxID=1652958 RepID=A0A916Z7X0_9BACL|nr:hypothetical protein GCM10010911_41500 [Paenibacillus nasutitermitis]